MSKVEKMSVSVTTAQAEAIREAVREGAYASSSDAVRDALRLWEQRRKTRAESISKARILWDHGVASGFAEAEPMDQVIAAARQRAANRK